MTAWARFHKLSQQFRVSPKNMTHSWTAVLEVRGAGGILAQQWLLWDYSSNSEKEAKIWWMCLRDAPMNQLVTGIRGFLFLFFFSFNWPTTFYFQVHVRRLKNKIKPEEAQKCDRNCPLEFCSVKNPFQSLASSLFGASPFLFLDHYRLLQLSNDGRASLHSSQHHFNETRTAGRSEQLRSNL